MTEEQRSAHYCWGQMTQKEGGIGAWGTLYYYGKGWAFIPRAMKTQGKRVCAQAAVSLQELLQQRQRHGPTLCGFVGRRRHEGT